MRAVVEAVALIFADAVDALGYVGTTYEHLLAIGAGTRSDLLLQTIANATGCRLGLSDAADVGPALGAARLASVASDPTSRTAALSKPDVSTWFEPEGAGAEALAIRFKAYGALYPALNTVQAAPR